MRADSGAASDASRAKEPPSDASARGEDRVERPVGALEPKPVCLGASGLCGATNRASVSSSLTRTALRRVAAGLSRAPWAATACAAAGFRLPGRGRAAPPPEPPPVREAREAVQGAQAPAQRCGSAYLQLVVAPSLVRQGG